jgi:hypothetical protein
MFKSVLVIAGVIGGVLLGGTDLATGDHYKDKEKDFKPCKLEVTDSPKIQNKHCKPKSTPEVTPTPVQTPVITPQTPKATPTPTPKAAVSPAPAAIPARSDFRSQQKLPATLPSVGADGK